MCEPSSNLHMNIVSSKDIENLLAHFSKTIYKAKDGGPIANEALQKCIELMKADYHILTIGNTNGELCGQYPSQLIIPANENAHNTGRLNNATDIIYESAVDIQKLRELIGKARFARCRARFPVPVILYRGKYICRSATLSGGPEIYTRTGVDILLSVVSIDNCDNYPYSDDDETLPDQSDWQLFDRVRHQDIKLLKALNVETIIDFMVEKKKVKFGLNVTSSEKVDKENRYNYFNILSLPYPGCEFFKDYRDNNYTGEGLIFDWEQAHVDANINVPEDPILNNLHIEWANYKNWDLVQITQNYMRLLLKYIQEQSNGLLIHCISGWDRTPLFISLLRLTLWADGLAHQGLDAQQILYLTIAYDWMLFSHHLPDRINKGEEIFFFCFYMLKHLVDDDYSIVPNRHKQAKLERTNEKTVIRTDSDVLLEAVLLEQDPRGSNISLNSACSSVSSKSQDQQSMLHSSYDDGALHDYLIGGISAAKELNRSPQVRRTSPVTVPAATRLRTRHESSPSVNSSGSWQIITGTGSLRGSDTTSESNGMQALNYSECSGSQDSSHTLVDEDTVLTYNPDGLPNGNSAAKEVNRSPQVRRTSPVSVPTATRRRTRHVSSPSVNSSGSWQFITGTGSLHGSDTTSESNGFSALNYGDCSLHDSSHTLADEDSVLTYNSDGIPNRKKRLLKVREIFYHNYSSAIGFSYNDGTESSLGSILGNIAEKVGLSTRT